MYCYCLYMMGELDDSYSVVVFFSSLGYINGKSLLLVKLSSFLLLRASQIHHALYDAMP